MATRRHDRGGHEGSARANPQLATDIGIGVAGLVLIPLVFYFGAGIFVPRPAPDAPGLHVGSFAETKDLRLSLEAANAYIERAEYVYRENYLNIFRERLTRARADLSDRDHTVRADLEWQWASTVLDEVKKIYTKIKRSIDKGEDPRLAALSSTVQDRLRQIEEERKKLDSERVFIR